jgi:UDP:flavonoid glycosyltransferase YjiC (YdhE family)
MVGAGHEVRIATGKELCPVVSRLGLQPVAAGIEDRALVAEAHRRWPESRHRPPAEWAARMFTDIAAPAVAAQLTEMIASWRPDLVIREEGEYGAPVAAAAAGVPWATLGWGSPLPPRTALNRLSDLLAPLWKAARLPSPDGRALYGSALLDPCPPSLYGDNAPPFPAHPMRPTTIELRPGVRSSRRPRTRPLAYVGFGTVPLYREQPQLAAAVTAVLLQRDFDVVVSTGGAELGPQLRALDHERVRIEEWVSLGRLLPSCSLAVSHGGAGTVLAALAAGLPLLLLPRGAPSQLRMSRACADRGVARVVTSEPASPEELDDALTALIGDERPRAVARELAGEIAGMPDPDHAARLLETAAAAT